ncbi:GntP family permease [Maribellus comscasis]|uniref:GntP family permease n=1 Tax=Maribellus comscasis TaxID=2681766 RepID=A0A6I6K4B4_9BACT|nr:GntP family permease [Maribellus comscasis]QGY47467.1 GntP family permease [Maribellus comscasis]
MWLIILLLLSIVFIIISTSVLKWHPFLSLILVAFGFGVLSGKMTLTEVVETVNDGFGSTIGYIGIVILAGSIIGKFLEMSGGAFKLAGGALKLVGKKKVPLAMSIVGYIVSIPVFCDSAFIVLSPLAKAISKKLKISLAMLAIALSLGLYVTHSLIPPTPGPVAAAGILQADLGMVILYGLPVSLIGLVTGWLFSLKIASKHQIKTDSGQNEKEQVFDDKNSPSLVKSLLPVFVPIILIVIRSVSILPSIPFGEGNLFEILNFIGQPSVALLIGVGLSFLLPAKLTKDMLSTTGWLGQGIIAAASIIIVTGSGGAFGKVLQASGIAAVIQNNLSGAQTLGIWLPVIIALSLKIAQGSSTVAIITTASLMAPLLASLGMDSPTARALVVTAIGAGSIIASHANDSYFWVVTQMTGMNVKQGYKLQTLGTLVMGIMSATAVWLISLWVL